MIKRAPTARAARATASISSSAPGGGGAETFHGQVSSSAPGGGGETFRGQVYLVAMPQLSPSMTGGTVARWLKVLGVVCAAARARACNETKQRAMRQTRTTSRTRYQKNIRARGGGEAGGGQCRGGAASRERETAELATRPRPGGSPGAAVRACVCVERERARAREGNGRRPRGGVRVCVRRKRSVGSPMRGVFAQWLRRPARGRPPTIVRSLLRPTPRCAPPPRRRGAGRRRRLL